MPLTSIEPLTSPSSHATRNRPAPCQSRCSHVGSHLVADIVRSRLHLADLDQSVFILTQSRQGLCSRNTRHGGHQICNPPDVCSGHGRILAVEVSSSPFEVSIAVIRYLDRTNCLGMASGESTSQPEDSHISHADTLIYWNAVAATPNGMLGDMLRMYPQISRIDLRGSLNFLTEIRGRADGSTERDLLDRSVDCGAGIGRVTAGFLSKVCRIVDAVEPVEKFAKVLREMLLTGEGRVGEVYVVVLQDWIPVEKYDVIWNQWCLGHLTDDELQQFLLRCKAALKEGGWIVIKENMSTNTEGKDMFDEEDSSVTRTHEKFQTLFQNAGLLMAKTELQTGFPKKLLPVRFYGLQSH